MSVAERADPMARAMLPLVNWLVREFWDIVDPLGLEEPFDLVDLIRVFGRTDSWQEVLWWQYCVSTDDEAVETSASPALSAAWRRRLRRSAKREFSRRLPDFLGDPLAAAFVAQIQRLIIIAGLIRVLRSRLAILGVKQESVAPNRVLPVQEITRRLQAAYRQPDKATEILPPSLLVGPIEGARLLDELGPEGYGWVLRGILWQILARPGTLKRPHLRRDSYETLFAENGTEITAAAGPEEAAALLLRRVSEKLLSADSVNFWLRLRVGGVLRHEYGLSRGRKVHPEPSADRLTSWDPDDDSSMYGYEQVDWRLTLEAIHDEAPPAQQEAIEIYLEASKSGRNVAEVSKERERDPVVVRNNLAALKHRVRNSPRIG